ncbi:hypothetical protein NW754_008307 [Fusarium falciforme]|nr:hypothetical protein NW754_008307 [Fusarium falciforme]
MSTLPPDPYKALGVSPDAQLPEIRSAHRKLVLKCHPDKVQDPTLKAQKQDEFQQVQQAYELLSDEKQRQKYDDQVRLQELREQMRAKVASSSSSRSTPSFKYEIRTNDRTYKTTSPSAKVFSYSRSYEDTDLRGADIFEGVRTVRREASYQGKPSRREERERDRDREIREREKERERERERRKKAEDAVRRAEKEAKEARRAEKKQKEKEKDKERKRESEEKKRHAKPYIETYDDEEPAPKSEKKKSSKKHDRDRSAHREEAPPATDSVPPPPMPSIPTEQSYEDKESEALKYINASRQQKKNPYARHMQPPAAPTPPPSGHHLLLRPLRMMMCAGHQRSPDVDPQARRPTRRSPRKRFSMTPSRLTSLPRVARMCKSRPPAPASCQAPLPDGPAPCPAMGMAVARFPTCHELRHIADIPTWIPVVETAPRCTLRSLRVNPRTSMSVAEKSASTAARSIGPPNPVGSM